MITLCGQETLKTSVCDLRVPVPTLVFLPAVNDQVPPMCTGWLELAGFSAGSFPNLHLVPEVVMPLVTAKKLLKPVFA